jgi:hypothetical protein
MKLIIKPILGKDNPIFRCNNNVYILREAERGNDFIYSMFDESKQGILFQALIFFFPNEIRFLAWN